MEDGADDSALLESDSEECHSARTPLRSKPSSAIELPVVVLSDAEHDIEDPELYCSVCDQEFVSLRNKEKHMETKKHAKAVERQRARMEEDLQDLDRLLDESTDAIGGLDEHAEFEVERCAEKKDTSFEMRKSSLFACFYRITDVRCNNGVIEYHIKWCGFPERYGRVCICGGRSRVG